ncbi:hypothetical protein PoB_002920200 [Plakobranchus ocellatus]|uniref:Uncharacterized protein n=1 Tax=Plakobranchus ocellatus TaxID=259542 RepID=A0AAV4A775_9GAST|nr:hypothetical protein PoB_002920200 [Plakobranchus ocellatus]
MSSVTSPDAEAGQTGGITHANLFCSIKLKHQIVVVHLAVSYKVGGPRFGSHYGPKEFFNASCVRPASKDSSVKVKAARKAMVNYLRMPCATNNQDHIADLPLLGPNK